MKKMDMKNMMMHLKEHQKYPATKQEIMETCQKLSDFSMDDKKYFEDNLPEGTYGSAEDVMKALSTMDAGRMHHA